MYAWIEAQDTSSLVQHMPPDVTGRRMRTSLETVHEKIPRESSHMHNAFREFC